MNLEPLTITYTPMDALTKLAGIESELADIQREVRELRALWTTEEPQTEAPSYVPKRRVAIVIGHGRQGDSGATSADGTSEEEYNNKVLDVMLELCPQLHTIRHTEHTTYQEHQRKINALLSHWNIAAALELHFNAFDNKVAGFEYLYWSYSLGGRDLAQHLSDAHACVFSQRPNRGIKYRDSSHRGALFLGGIPAIRVLCEPFFGDNPNEWAIYSRPENIRKLAQIYLDGLTAAGYLEKQ